LKNDGDAVKKGEPLMEIETDKAAVEIESPADGILRDISARAGDVVPVGKTVAFIYAANETREKIAPTSEIKNISVSPVAQQIAKEHGIDLARVQARGARIEKADVMTHVQTLSSAPASIAGKAGVKLGRVLASPNARRLAHERDVDLENIRGTGPNGAILAADILSASSVLRPSSTISNVWRIMAERTTASWTSVPHFFLLREVNAARLISWRASLKKRGAENITYTDLLIKLVAANLRAHPRVNAQWNNGSLKMIDDINIGIAVATEDGLVVPVIPRADELSLKAIAARREEMVARAQEKKLRPDDLRGGTFTISNLGMYGVDAFTAIINAPQAAILAVGRIAERVVPVQGAPGIAPMMTLSLSCDHRVIDGARGAQFLDALANLIEEPMGLVE
ncbi:MAG: 2-oxo acid dehydrogenase subunit E2, partial [Chloroflexi bacterium]|nr:2-oxo acid dehydrogenase subunit E2 [Chloroflexota bacterium]